MSPIKSLAVDQTSFRTAKQQEQQPVAGPVGVSGSPPIVFSSTQPTTAGPCATKSVPQPRPAVSHTTMVAQSSARLVPLTELAQTELDKFNRANWWTDDLLEMSATEINRYLKRNKFSDGNVAALKAARRRHKNRVYSANARQRRKARTQSSLHQSFLRGDLDGEEQSLYKCFRSGEYACEVAC